MADWKKALKLAKRAQELTRKIKDDADTEEVFYTVAADKSSCGVYQYCKRVAGKLICK